MRTWFFASDLHGDAGKYRRLFACVESETPGAVLLGGDLLAPGFGLAPAAPGADEDLVEDVLAPGLARLRHVLGSRAPVVLAIPGNDDPAAQLAPLTARGDLWTWAHARRVDLGDVPVYGYGCVPPTPFPLKDWERYDVSRYVDPGCVSPEEGMRSVAVDPAEARHGTIREDLERLAGRDDLSNAVMLFHAPPYDTALDRAALDGRRVDHVPLDVHVGSIAIRRFVEARGPRVSLHGHVHESARITGAWRVRLGRATCLGAAHDGPELALVRFDPARPEDATRELLPPA